MLEPQRLEAPQVMPVELTELKKAIDVDFGGNDDTLDTYIAAVTGHLDGWEGILGRCLITQTWLFRFSAFCDVSIDLAPIQSAVVAYIDADGVERTLSASVYREIATASGLSLQLKDGQSWPALADQPDAVRVTVVAGYGDAATDVDPGVKTVIYLMVRSLFDDGEMAAPKAMIQSVSRRRGRL